MKQTGQRLLPLEIALLVALNVWADDSMLAQTRPSHEGIEPAFDLRIPLEFEGRVVSGSLRQSEIAGLLDLPVRNGSGETGVEMTRGFPNGERFMVHTCQQWKKALAEKAYASTTYDMKMEGYLVQTCSLLFELQEARLPVRSFLANPRVGIADLDLLPVDILGAWRNDKEHRRAKAHHMTVSQVVATKDIKESDDDNISLLYGGFEQFLWEAGRADFDGDGAEDILVFTSCRADGGTAGWADYFILTRTGASGPLKVINKVKGAS